MPGAIVLTGATVVVVTTGELMSSKGSYGIRSSDRSSDGSIHRALQESTDGICWAELGMERLLRAFWHCPLGAVFSVESASDIVDVVLLKAEILSPQVTVDRLKAKETPSEACIQRAFPSCPAGANT